MNNKLTPQELSLYLGQEVQSHGSTGILSAVEMNGEYQALFRGHLVNYFNINEGEHKLLLRSLSDITDEEVKELWDDVLNLNPNYISKREHIISCIGVLSTLEAAKSTAYLLSKGFDLFGFIEANKALDKTKLNQHEEQ